MIKLNEVLIGILIAIIIFLSFKACKKPTIETVEVPIRVEVEVPVVVKEFDTILEPIPVKVVGETKIDSTYYYKYLEAKSMLIKDSLFKEAITIREYKETVEDDTIKIDVYSKVRGSLIQQQIGYETKPRSIILDTIMDVPVKYKSKLGAGFEIGVPTGAQLDINQAVIVKANAMFDTNKIIYSVGYDTQRNAWFGLTYKF